MTTRPLSKLLGFSGVWLVIFLRLSAAVYILLDPLWGAVAAITFDWLDAYILIHRLDFNRHEYHLVDKNLDWIAQTAMLISGINHGWGQALLALFLFRLIGQWFFLKTGKVIYFVFFPNFFEAAFLWLVAARTIPAVARLSFLQLMWGLGMALVLKQLHEIYLHFIWPRQLIRLKKTGYPRWLQFLGVHHVGI